MGKRSKLGKPQTQKVPITMRALLQRINRKLSAEGHEQVKTTRGDRWRSELGDYYVVDLNRNMITAKHVKPVEWGRELGVLREWETVVEEE